MPVSELSTDRVALNSIEPLRTAHTSNLVEAGRKLQIYDLAARASEFSHCKSHSLTRRACIEKFAEAVLGLLPTRLGSQPNFYEFRCATSSAVQRFHSATPTSKPTIVRPYHR